MMLNFPRKEIIDNEFYKIMVCLFILCWHQQFHYR